MAKETMLTFLDRQIEKKLSDYEVELDWDVQNHTIEIIMHLYAENKSNQAIDDIAGLLSAEDVIEFEDGVLLYDEKKAVFDPTDFLTVIPFNGKKGMERKKMVALIDMLKEVLDEGQSDLLDFLTSEAEVFELKFDPAVFAAKTAPLSADFVPYPSY